MDTQQRIIDLRSTSNHPLSFRYSEIYDCALLDGRLEHGRSQPSLEASRSTPFVKSARAAISFGLDHPDAIHAAAEVLRRYYEMVVPRNAAEWLNLGSPHSSRLEHTPPWGAVFPWRARTQESYQQAYENAALSENKRVGQAAGIAEGWLFCGPVSERKIMIESERIINVLRSMVRSGYTRNNTPDGDIRATALINDDDEWRWLITAGNHRASAAAALDFEAIPVRINLAISRSDVKYWKHVQEGLYSIDEALSIFDTIFQAQPTSITSEWLNHTEKS